MSAGGHQQQTSDSKSSKKVKFTGFAYFKQKHTDPNSKSSVESDEEDKSELVHTDENVNDDVARRHSKFKKFWMRHRSCSESHNEDKGLVKKLLIRLHKAKLMHSADDVSVKLSSSTDMRKGVPADSQVSRHPPSISMLADKLSPDSEYYVTVSGGYRSKLLTFHPLSKDQRPHLSPVSENPNFEIENCAPCNDEENVLCAKIVPSTLIDSNKSLEETQNQSAVSKRFIVSALSCDPDKLISNIEKIPDDNISSLPGVRRFIYKTPPRGVNADIGVAEDVLQIFDDREIYSQFMKSHTCYQILPISSKMVVFDIELEVKKAFYALLYNGVRAAPIWDSKSRSFVGMITITDFILILKKYYKTNKARIEELERHKIRTWREVLKHNERPLVHIKPDDSLYEAIKVIHDTQVHRLLVLDPLSGDALNIITHKRLLRFLYLYIYELPRPSFLNETIESLGIGTFDDVKTVHLTDSVFTALNLFIDSRVSALPVVNAQNKLCNIYSRFDVVYLAANQTFNNLDATIESALKQRDTCEGVYTCLRSETLLCVMERLVKTGVHRLVCVDENNYVTGVIALSDILCFTVLRAKLHDKGGGTRLRQNISHLESSSNLDPFDKVAKSALESIITSVSSIENTGDKSDEKTINASAVRDEQFSFEMKKDSKISASIESMNDAKGNRKQNAKSEFVFSDDPSKCSESNLQHIEHPCNGVTKSGNFVKESGAERAEAADGIIHGGETRDRADSDAHSGSLSSEKLSDMSPGDEKLFDFVESGALIYSEISVRNEV